MRLASFISYALHPVLMPSVGILILFNSGMYGTQLPEEFKRFVYLLVILCTVILPLTILPVLILAKNIHSITLNERRERLIPLLFTALCFYFAYHLVARFSPIRVLNHFLLACSVSVVVLLLITSFWKISIHMMGMGGICALIGALSLAFRIDMTLYLALAILATGAVASSRLKLNAHLPTQLTAGFLTGFVITGTILFRTLH